VTLMPVADLPARAGGLHVFTAWGKGFAQWWLSGLREAAPARWREWAEGEARPQVTLWREGDSVTCRLVSARGVSEARFALPLFNAATLDQWLIGQGVAREREQKERGISSRDTRRFPRSAPELRPGPGEIPDAVGHDEVERLGSKWQRVHRREDEVDGIRWSLLKASPSRSGEHGARQIRSGHTPARLGQMHGITSGTTPDVEKPGARAQRPRGEIDQGRIGRRLDETLDRPSITPR